MLCFSLVSLNGCRGCRWDDPKDQAQQDSESNKREKKKKPDYEIADSLLQPGMPETPQQYAKPGHWATASQRMKANYFDFVGQSLTQFADKQGRSLPVEYTPFQLRSTRPVALVKGRPKEVETTFYVPPIVTASQMQSELQDRHSGSSKANTTVLFRPMPSYQYHFVVLAKEPSRYSYLQSLDAVHVPFDGESDADDTEDTLHYRVILPNISKRIPLSDNPLTWTSIAYILWDEVDPDLFTREQEEALVDWIHWGGDLIISGPDSLDLLQNSFLERLLPAVREGTRSLEASSLEALSRGWTLSSKKSPGKPLVPTAPWTGIGLAIHADARPLPSTGKLLVERSIGRGRIVVSAMQLAERDLINWNAGFNSWFNACVLRRPARKYRTGYFGDVTLNWADEALAKRRLDAQLTTGLRYFARDVGVDTNYHYKTVDSFQQLVPPKQIGGVGAWNEFSATAEAARATLVEAAGVQVPEASFVVFYLTGYLIVLVPLNWLFFHAIRRVEWAWVAAPVIAVIGTIVVVNQAQLDIGFVRAQSEIGLLELQPKHDRGHLARYTALYTSLSTTYDLEFENLTTLAVPFPRDSRDPTIRGQGRTNVDFQRFDNVRLTGLQVSSNSTKMVHSEQMFQLRGSIRLGKSTAQNRAQIENRSQLHLRSVGLIRRLAEGERGPAGTRFLGTWIGDLPPGQSAAIGFRPLTLVEGEVVFAEDRAAEGRHIRTKRLDLEPMFRLAYDPQYLDLGEVRLVARVDGVLPGETITPAASQVRGATLVVAHLQYGPRPVPQPDVNTKKDVADP